MRCLITGASGFLGSHLVRALVRSGHDVAALVRPSSDLWRLTDVRQSILFLKASLNAISSVAPEIEEFRPEVVFHFAWTGGNSSKYVDDPEQVFENVPGSVELIKIVAAARCKTFLYAGSSVEYGAFKVPTREVDLPQPTNLYGAAKYGTLILSEGLCRTYAIRFCGVRIFWTYGPMDEAERMIPSVIAALLDGQRPKLTEGSQVWDFVYVDDAVEAFIKLAETPTAQGIFNLGSASPVTIRTVVEKIRDRIDPRLKIGFGEVPYKPGQVMHLEPDISRLTCAAHWKPRTTLEQGLNKTVDWYRRNRSQISAVDAPRES